MTIKINKKNKSKRVEILRVGSFERRFEDNLKISLSDLEKLKQNFDDNARRQELDGRPVLPFNFSHNSWEEAAGWITGLEIDKDLNNFQALFAEVEWTKKGAQKIRDNEFKFVSSEFARNFKDSESGKIFDIILGGAALTNIPFVRDMEAVQLSENGNGQRTFVSLAIKLSGDKPDSNKNQGSNMKFDEILKTLDSVSPEDKKKLQDAVKAETQKLSGENVKLTAGAKKAKDELKLSEGKLDELKKDMSGSEDQGERLKLAETKTKDLEGKVSSLTKQLAEDARKAEFNTMLAEGKVCEAQRKPFMKQDFTEFAQKAEEIKLEEAGSNAQGDETMEKAEDKLIKLAEKIQKEQKVEYGEAMKLALSENPKLAAKAGQ